MNQEGPDDGELARLREKRIHELQEKARKTEIAQILTVTDSNLMSTVRSHPHVVIDFWAEWCGPCKMVTPIIEQLAQEMSGLVVFGKCNVDENPRVAAGFGISAIPTLMLFSHGKPADQIVGALPADALRRRIRSVFGT